MSKNGAPKYVDGGRKIMDEDLRRDLEILRLILLRLSHAADDTSPLDVFNAYESVLRENGLNPARHRSYIRILYRLISSKKLSWNDEWRNLMRRIGFSQVSSDLNTPLFPLNNTDMENDPFIVNGDDYRSRSNQQKSSQFASEVAQTIKSQTAMFRRADQYRSQKDKILLANSLDFMLEKYRYYKKIDAVYLRKADAVYRAFIMLKYFPRWVQKLRNIQSRIYSAGEAYRLILIGQMVNRWRQKTRERLHQKLRFQKNAFLLDVLLKWSALTVNWNRKHEYMLKRRVFTNWMSKRRRNESLIQKANVFFQHSVLAHSFKTWKANLSIKNAATLYEKKVVFMSFNRWHANYESHVLDLQKAELFSQKAYYSIALHKWKLRIEELSDLMNKADDLYEVNLLQRMLVLWRRKATTYEKIDFWMDGHDVDIVKSAFFKWKNKFIKVDRNFELADTILQNTFLTKWRLAVRVKVVQEKRNKDRLIVTFRFWYYLMKAKSFQHKRDHRLLTIAWEAWKDNYQRRIKLQKEAQELQLTRIQKIAKQYLIKWRISLLDIKELSIRAEKLHTTNEIIGVWNQWVVSYNRKVGMQQNADLFFKRKTLRVVFEHWRYLRETNMLLRLENKVVDFREVQSEKLVLRCWNAWVARLLSVSQMLDTAELSTQKVVVRAYEAWSFRYNHQKEIMSQADQFYNERLMRSAMVFWRYQLRAIKFYFNISDWKRREFNRQTLRNAFDAWHLLMFRVTSLVMQADRFHEQKKNKLLGKYFRKWLQRMQLNQEESSLLEAEATIEGNRTSRYMHTFDTTLPMQNDEFTDESVNFENRWKQELKTPISRFSKFLRPIPPNTR
ncbi:spindle pole body half bridge protein Sfi1 [Schizosaccharomyces pombe]|uniref:Protein sfi1 n=1 Tax=Schizosaccharomyces pombe (strain 972 / ATCC 24843) TaxID=284812 RepID=SFI1_SCHPO|nr:protein Sfi1 [Schizosaccharomyces pombe]O13652.3 RecName: Full=Protein sfi1; AltName: Full=Suppressor of fermentation induced loss of stress resistance protein 1 [Schizosaccharomyces pombe 972h-]CAA17820.2 spindle pole body protein Sfi1 [Schizosaccharomyces pombe]|eukprot:NP_595568.1 protein Sfi1 [Schizosaccharomyces pombe]